MSLDSWNSWPDVKNPGKSIEVHAVTQSYLRSHLQNGKEERSVTSRPNDTDTQAITVPKDIVGLQVNDKQSQQFGRHTSVYGCRRIVVSAITLVAQCLRIGMINLEVKKDCNLKSPAHNANA